MVPDLKNNKEVKIAKCNIKGDRGKNLKVIIGLDDGLFQRDYFAYTNDYK